MRQRPNHLSNLSLEACVVGTAGKADGELSSEFRDRTPMHQSRTLPHQRRRWCRQGVAARDGLHRFCIDGSLLPTREGCSLILGLGILKCNLAGFVSSGSSGVEIQCSGFPPRCQGLGCCRYDADVVSKISRMISAQVWHLRAKDERARSSLPQYRGSRHASEDDMTVLTILAFMLYPCRP